MMPLLVLGGGGHARVVIDTARASGDFELVGVLDDHLHAGVVTVDDVPVVGPISAAAVRQHPEASAVIAIGDNRSRAAIAERLSTVATWATIIHPRASIAAHVQIGVGSVVFANAVVQPGAWIGQHVIVNTAATVDHDSAIDDFGHIAPGANLAGNVRAGEGAMFGIGSCVIPGCHVGAWATVGAGAAVIRDIPPQVTIGGVPASVIAPREEGASPG